MARQGARGLLILAALAGCEDREAREWRCIGPLVELVRWRDEEESRARYGTGALSPAALAAEERRRVEAVVAQLAPERARCATTWRVTLFQPPDNPGLRLREEAVLRLLGKLPQDYPAEAVGRAGVTVDGRPPIPDR